MRSARIVRAVRAEEIERIPQSRAGLPGFPICGLARRSCSDRQARMSKTYLPPHLTAQSAVRSHQTGRIEALHYHRQVFQLMLEDWQGTTGHFDAACSVERGCG